MSEAEYDSVVDALEAADDDAGGATGSVIRRTIREAKGKPSYPAPNDYLAAVQATDGEVAISLNSDDEQVIAIVQDGVYRVAGDRDGHISSVEVAAAIDQHGCELVLYDDVADHFEETSASTNGNGGTPTAGP